MRVGDRRAGITRADLIGMAGTFGIRNPAGIIAQIADAVMGWPHSAAEQRVPAATIATVGTELEARAMQLVGGRS